jgi:hypothetical protein
MPPWRNLFGSLMVVSILALLMFMDIRQQSAAVPSVQVSAFTVEVPSPGQDKSSQKISQKLSGMLIHLLGTQRDWRIATSKQLRSQAAQIESFVKTYPSEQGNPVLWYTSVATNGELENVKVSGLDQFCQTSNILTEQPPLHDLEYEGIFAGIQSSGVMTVPDCTQREQEETQGTFQDARGCSGDVKIITLLRNKDENLKVTQATISWHYRSCHATNETFVAVVREQVQ